MTDTQRYTWCVLRWNEGTQLGGDYTVGPDGPERPTARVVRRLGPKYIGAKGEDRVHRESDLQVRERAHALARALNAGGIGRERALRGTQG